MRSFRFLSLLLVMSTALAAAPGVARAELPSLAGEDEDPYVPDEPEEPGSTRSVWYGGPSLGLDLAAAGLFVAAVGSNGDKSGVFLGSAIGLHALGAPIVHAANGQYGRAAGSFLLRIGVPATTGLVIYGLGDCHGGDECLDRIFAGVLGAALAATVTGIVDDVAFSSKTVREQPSWTATLAPTGDGGMTLGLAGTF